MTKVIEEYQGRAKAFERAALELLTTHETSTHRVVTLSAAAGRIDDLGERQRHLLQQAMRCAELGIFRAAYTMAWLALMTELQEGAADDGFIRLNDARTKWAIQTIEELRENYTEYAQIDAMHAAGFVSKAEAKAIHGLLNDRNRCAHPGDFEPDLNTTLGYLSSVLAVIEKPSRARK